MIHWIGINFKHFKISPVIRNETPLSNDSVLSTQSFLAFCKFEYSEFFNSFLTFFLR